MPCYKPAARGIVAGLMLLAGVAELVDAPDLGSGDESCGGSSPSARTMRALRIAVADEPRFGRVAMMPSLARED